MTQSTRERLIAQSMRLFGINGYAGTSVADIEAAAGLSAGAGSLYRHFRSKEALLAAGIREQIAIGAGLLELLGNPDQVAALPLRERLIAVATAGLRRLEQERDLNRILIKDLARFPDLLATFREDELARVHHALAGWLSSQFPASAKTADLDALAAVLVGSISNYWMLCDIFGDHPAGISEERYLAALVDALLPSLVERTKP